MLVAPLKPQKIPDHLIYKAGKDTYRMFSVQSGKMLGIMKASAFDFYGAGSGNNSLLYKSLYIRLLEVAPFARCKGIGTELIKFAQKLSFRNECNGRIHLVAYNAENPGKAPHKFYRKLGFSTTSKEENRLIDEAIKNNTPIPAMLTQGSVMFLENFKIR